MLASGRGSNFQAVIDSIAAGRLRASIELLITDVPDAYAAERAERHGIVSLYIDPKEHSGEGFYEKAADELKKRGVELVLLAGFMRIVKKPLLEAYPMRIMNIHPALLPSFAGLHGQGQAVHYGVRVSGCTVHFVDGGMDTGPVIIQAAVPVYPEDTEEGLSERILKYEHMIYPEAIRLFSEGRLKVVGRKVMIKECKEIEGAIICPPIGG